MKGTCSKCRRALTLAVSAGEAPLLQAVVVVPAAVGVHLNAALLRHLPRVEGLVGLPLRPVHVAQARLIRPGPADWDTHTHTHTHTHAHAHAHAHTQESYVKAGRGLPQHTLCFSDFL